MKYLLFISLLILTNYSYGQDNLENNLTIDKIENIIFKDGLGRYMEGTVIKKITNLSGWENDTLTLYRYSVKDKIDTTLTAEVIMYNADVHRIANWIYFSMIDCKKSFTDNNINIIVNHIRGSSGFQFPIRGVVLEDIYTKNCGCITYDDCKQNKKCNDCKPDKIQESYIFFDGVTVKHNNIKLTICDFVDKPIRVTSYQMNELIEMKESDIKTVQTYARIASTDYQTYAKFMNAKYSSNLPLNSSNKFFLSKVREEYKKAMHSNRNNLISAWVFSNNLILNNLK